MTTVPSERAGARALIGYAVLRANFDAKAPSYFDNFRSFALSVLAGAHPRPIEKREVSAQIRGQFGIRMPELATNKLLRRMHGAGLVTFVGTNFVQITDKGIEQEPAVAAQVVSYQRRQTELVNSFGGFIEARFPQYAPSLESDLGTELDDYFERHSVPLLNQSLRGTAAPDPTRGKQFDFLISAFVTYLADNDQVRFSYVEEAAKGAILASVLTLDTSEIRKPLDRLKVVVDTPVLMNLLGHDGELLQAPARELISMALEQGAQVIAFRHSLKELDGILEGVEKALGSSRPSRSTNEAYLHFMDIGASAVDVAMLRADVQHQIEALGIMVIDKPEYRHEHSLDEGKLEELLQEKVHYREASTRLYDVDSLSAVHRMRRGRSSASLEHCGAVLVTSNSRLVVAANSFEKSRDEFSLAIRDEALAGILWVRSSAVESDVPRKLLLAAAYSGMQPSPTLWTKYLDEVDRLEQRATVTADEAVILRATSYSRTALMEETLGDPNDVTEESPLHVLERIKADHAAPYQEELELLREQARQAADSANSAAADWIENVDTLASVATERDAALEARDGAERRRAQAEQALEEMLERDRRRDDNLRAHSEATARRTLNWIVAITIVILIALSLGAAVGFPDGWKWIAVFPGVVVAVLGIVQLFIPGTVRDWLAPAESKLGSRLLRRSRQRLGLDGVPAGK